MRFTRIQFTPDLMPSDVTGASIWNQRDGDFEFRPGRSSPTSSSRTRSPRAAEDPGGAARGDAGTSGDDRRRTHTLEPPFLVIATQNPIEYEGTYPLPEAQLDRFLLRTAFGYPSREGEVDVLARRIERESDDVELGAVVDRETLLAMQRAIEGVHVAQSVQAYCVDLVAGPASPRAPRSERARAKASRS